MPIYKTLAHLISENALTDKCISLDIDNTLLYSSDETKNVVENKQTWVQRLNVYRNPKLLGIRNRVYHVRIIDVLTPHGAGELSEMSGILRDDVREFMAFCFHYFRIVNIWSAGKKKYVHEMVKILCADLPQQPNLIFSWDQCKITGTDLHKPLEFMFLIPGLENLMSHSNTFALDDRKSTADPNPENLILIPEYAPDFTVASLTKTDNALRQVMHWLMRPEVMNCTDIRTLDKTGIFEKKLSEVIEPVLMPEIETENLDHVPLLDLSNTANYKMLSHKEYNTKRSMKGNSYLSYKFLNS